MCRNRFNGCGNGLITPFRTASGENICHPIPVKHLLNKGCRRINIKSGGEYCKKLLNFPAIVPL
jgi:hypothetical protein